MDWRDTPIKFMMDIKIANENLVANHFPKPIICEGTHDKSCEFLQVYLWISNQFLKIYLNFLKIPISFGKYTSINDKTLCFVKYLGSFGTVLAVLAYGLTAIFYS